MKTHHFIWILAGVTFTGLLATSAATAQTVVSPAGSENIEGDRVFNDTFPFRNGGRVQELHTAADFAAIEGGGFQIIRMAFRPDQIVTEPHAAEWDLKMRLSTTPREPGGLANRFDDNHGDDVTTVFSDTVPLETNAGGPPGGPRNFDYVFNFDTPFPYDPAQGNLLVEQVLGPNAGPSSHDAHRPLPERPRIVFSRVGPDAEFAEILPVALNAISVIQFTVEPIPPQTFLRGDCNADGNVDIADVISLVNVLFAGFNLLDRSSPDLPCATDGGNVAILDVSGNEAIDVADIVGLASFLFGKGPPPGPACEFLSPELGCPESPGCQ